MRTLGGSSLLLAIALLALPTVASAKVQCGTNQGYAVRSITANGVECPAARKMVPRYFKNANHTGRVVLGDFACRGRAVDPDGWVATCRGLGKTYVRIHAGT